MSMCLIGAFLCFFTSHKGLYILPTEGIAQKYMFRLNRDFKLRQQQFPSLTMYPRELAARFRLCVMTHRKELDVRLAFGNRPPKERWSGIIRQDKNPAGMSTTFWCSHSTVVSSHLSICRRFSGEIPS